MEETNSPSETTSVAMEQSIDEEDRQSEGSPQTPPFLMVRSTEHEDFPSLYVSWALNIVSVALYGYAIYYQNIDPQGSLLNKMLDPNLQPYGLWKYLTYNSLWLQFISSCLHLITLIIPKYRVMRDVVFTTLAYPVGSLVVYTFWAVYFTQGRDAIYPAAIEPYYPVWLNHVTHTMMVPINFALTYLTFHRYVRNGIGISVLFIGLYSIYLFFIRWRSGTFVYPYLNQMSFIPFMIYLFSVGFGTLALYESGRFMTSVFHIRKLRRRLE